jgi:hypothetical protein
MTKQPFINDAPQSERYAVHVNDKHAHKNTMLSHTHPTEEYGGRYAAEVHSTIVGRDNPIPQYGHAASWSETQLPDEPPLGYAIDDQEPVGTEAEIQQSLNALGDDHRSPVAKESEDDAAACPASPRSKGGASSDRLSSLKSAAHQFRRRI